MEIISKQQAKLAGLLRYFTGQPCSRGHITERHTSSGTCVLCGNARQRQWNEDNRYSAKHYAANHERYVEMAQHWRNDHRDHARRLGRTEGAKLISTLNQMKRRAVEKGIEFTLTKADLIIPDVCPVLGLPLERGGGGPGRKLDNSPSFDRVDNTKGYTIDNVRVISWRANRLKADATLQEVQAIARYMETHNKKNNNASTTNVYETSTPPN
jgi:hypothetical protein